MGILTVNIYFFTPNLFNALNGFQCVDHFLSVSDSLVMIGVFGRRMGQQIRVHVYWVVCLCPTLYRIVTNFYFCFPKQVSVHLD